jgi:protein TonB
MTMRQSFGHVVLEETEARAPELLLLVAHQPRSQVFLQNLRDLIHPPENVPLKLESAPGTFWPDVFVDRTLPWRRFAQSGVYHLLAIALILAGSRFIAFEPRVTQQNQFNHAEVVYYSPSEYLPPLDTRRTNAAHPRKADPEYSRQPIISLPPEADNRSQTIVAAPQVKLNRDIALPNTIAIAENVKMPIGPAPVIPASQTSRLTPNMQRSIIAPPPAVSAELRQTMQAPQAAVIAPPPAVEQTSTRRVGDLNIGRSAVIAPAPQLALDAQRTSRRNAAAPNGQAGAPQVIAPPPTLATTGRSRAGSSTVALNLHPAVGAPPAQPAGNRRGSFAATPDGHHGASGAPGASANGNEKDSGTGAAGKNNGKLPPGLYVGKASNAAPVAGTPAADTSTASVNPKLMAGARPSLPAMRPERDSKVSEEERAVFGDRRFYSLSLNMPNLNSAGGSWIIRFAALKQEARHGPAQQDESSELSAPAATRKVDPAYPLELMRQNVSGTVILYGVIHSDGTVGSVRVLRSVDDRLDQFASAALTKWKFQPATKSGAPVDVEATFSIPFHPAKTNSNF